MEKRKKITQYRKRLDKTLASPDLTNEESIKALVSNQLRRLNLKHETEGWWWTDVSGYFDILSLCMSPSCWLSHPFWRYWSFFYMLKVVARMWWREGPLKYQIFLTCWGVLPIMIAAELLRWGIMNGKYVMLKFHLHCFCCIWYSFQPLLNLISGGWETLLFHCTEKK